MKLKMQFRLNGKPAEQHHLPPRYARILKYVQSMKDGELLTASALARKVKSCVQTLGELNREGIDLSVISVKQGTARIYGNAKTIAAYKEWKGIPD